MLCPQAEPKRKFTNKDEMFKSVHYMPSIDSTKSLWLISYPFVLFPRPRDEPLVPLYSQPRF